MKSWTIFNKTTGEIIKLKHADVHEKELLGLSPSEDAVEGAFSDGLIDLASMSPVPFPEKPSPHHYWDWPTKSWLPNPDAARAAKKAEIEAELSRRIYLPCNGFDADNVSRERISGMVARLQRGDGLPAGWVGWRDASNQQQWATDDAATVLANLTALSRAIEDREQALLVASWTRKANIADLPDIDMILSYDVTTGWPT